MSRVVGQKVIQWTWAEMKMLAQIIVNEQHRNPKLDIIAATKEAQKSLLVGRRRNIRTAAHVSNKLREFVKELQSKTPEPIVSVAPAPAPVPVLAAQKDPELSLEDQLVDVCATFLEKVIREALGRLEIPSLPTAASKIDLPSMLAPILAKRPKHDPQPESGDAKKRLPVVLVCGLKGFQQSPIERAMTNRLRLKFWYQESPNERLQELKDKAAGADHVLFSIEATSHTAVGIVEGMGKRFLRCPGASSAIIRTLESLADSLEGVER
jgi:hypothetical protein